MIATEPHVTSSLGLRKFQADGFLFNRAYNNNVNDLQSSKWYWQEATWCEFKLLHTVISFTITCNIL